MNIHEERALRQAANIVRFYDAALPEEIEGGLRWYSDVREQCFTWASEYALSIKQVAGALAVLSPNTDWWHNNLYALAAIQNFRNVSHYMELLDLGVRTFYGNIEKAYNVLKHADYSQVSGKKVRSFWHNIWNVESTHVTHDVHSRRVVENDTLLTNKAMTQKQYNTAVYAYHTAHKVIQLSNPQLEHVYQLQAITWVVARRLRNEGVQSI